VFKEQKEKEGSMFLRLGAEIGASLGKRRKMKRWFVIKRVGEAWC
jgi:hypothetical protein